jgi:hypothetical protein
MLCTTLASDQPSNFLNQLAFRRAAMCYSNRHEESTRFAVLHVFFGTAPASKRFRESVNYASAISGVIFGPAQQAVHGIG